METIWEREVFKRIRKPALGHTASVCDNHVKAFKNLFHVTCMECVQDLHTETDDDKHMDVYPGTILDNTCTHVGVLETQWHN